MGTQPTPHHAWLENLVGEWNVTSEMWMGPDQPMQTGTGTEKISSLNGLWAYCEGTGTMPGGGTMRYFMTLGYDVTFNEYRGAWFADVSSHLWKYTGTLSEDGKKMTLECEGPDMMSDEPGATAMYRDVHELIDTNTRTMTSYGLDKNSGEWIQFNKSTITRKG